MDKDIVEIVGGVFLLLGLVVLSVSLLTGLVFLTGGATLYQRGHSGQVSTM